MAISQDPTSLKETWLDLDGRRLLYRTNADSPPPADAPICPEDGSRGHRLRQDAEAARNAASMSGRLP